MNPGPSHSSFFRACLLAQVTLSSFPSLSPRCGVRTKRITLLSASWLRFVAVTATCLLLLIGAAQAQDNPVRASSANSAEHRVALVIGNAAYAQASLANPVNDARAMASRLRTLGFDVILRENLKTRDIGGVYREFRSKIAPGNVALVFYAGHGIQFKGQNYFPAVDAVINSEEDVPLQSLNLSSLLDNMEEAKAGVSLVFLDACRNNPYSRSFRSPSSGLAKVEAASGTLIHYATKPGSVAADGDGKNGTYTEALLAQMSEPGIPVELMLKRVANRVVAKTKGKQEPWVEGSLRGDFYFFGPTTVQGQPAGSATGGQARSKEQIEDDFWDSIKGSGDSTSLSLYLDTYPSGRYVGPARLALSKLMSPPASSQTTAVSAPTKDMKPGTVFKDCPDCPEMVVIPSGRFDMGRDGATHRVNLKSFAIGKTEVTQTEWKTLMGNNPSKFKDCGPVCPVEQVKWDEAQLFIQKLSAKTGHQYLLPSESEWEYACRAGERTEFCGSNNLSGLSWYGTEPAAVRAGRLEGKKSNSLGIFDMSGGVWEWTLDCWNENLSEAPSDGSAWAVGDCRQRVLRGGSWNIDPSVANATDRLKTDLSRSNYFDVGFRLVRSLP